MIAPLLSCNYYKGILYVSIHHKYTTHIGIYFLGWEFIGVGYARKRFSIIYQTAAQYRRAVDCCSGLPAQTADRGEIIIN